MGLRSITWEHLQEQWHYPFNVGGKNGGYTRKVIELGVNSVHKAMVALAAVVAAVATPFLVLIDLCSYSIKKLGSVVSAHSILDFYQQGGRNDKGVTLEEIWGWDDIRLEAQHDFIQWLFPTKQKGVNGTAPLTTDETIAAFKSDKTLREKMGKSFDRMLKFYGFTRSFWGGIQMGPDFDRQANNWLNPSNHNYLRITRILTCLRLHGLEHLAKAFFGALEEVYQHHSNQIGSTTFGYWKSASK